MMSQKITMTLLVFIIRVTIEAFYNMTRLRHCASGDIVLHKEVRLENNS